jgi:hypothetical protein
MSNRLQDAEGVAVPGDNELEKGAFLKRGRPETGRPAVPVPTENYVRAWIDLSSRRCALRRLTAAPGRPSWLGRVCPELYPLSSGFHVIQYDELIVAVRDFEPISIG